MGGQQRNEVNNEMQKKTLLIINSSPTQAGITKSILEQAGYFVHSTAGIASASKYLADHKPDGIVLGDSPLDEKSIEICRELRKTFDTPIMFLSACKDDELSALQAGATDFLVKPFDHDVLKFRIATMLNAKKEKNTKIEWLNKAGSSYRTVAACLLVAFIAVVIFSVVRDFRFGEDIPVPPTPLDEFDFSYENMDQMKADRILNEIIIKFADPAEFPLFAKQIQREIDKVQKIGFIEALGVYLVKADDLEKNPNAVLNRLKNNRFIEYVEPNYLLDYGLAPYETTQYKQQLSALNLIKAHEGWDITTGEDKSPIIAVIDSGVIAGHKDLPELLNGFAAVSGLSPNNDKVGHGTTVAGVLGAIGTNNIGIAGINWDAKIIPIKVDNANGSVTVLNVARGIVFAADNGARVLNLSLGMSSDSATLQSAIDYAYGMGCVIIAASGNDGKEGIIYPARYSNVIAVGATTNGTAKVSYSNYGAELDVVAMGSYYSTTAAGSYGSVSGTSFASPQVAGLASLILTINPNLTNEEVYSLIRDNASRKGVFNKQLGYGLINIGETLKKTPVLNAPVSKDPVCSTPPVITLNSFVDLELFVGDDYQEMGYSAVDCFGFDLTPYVTVTGFVDTSKAGVYTLIYSVIDDSGNTAKVERLITVKDIPVEEIDLSQFEPPTITVIGSNPIVLYVDSGTPYIEQGALAIDSDDSDISAYVEIIGEPDRYTPGSYTITYSVTGRSGVAAVTERNVVIVSPTFEKISRAPYGFSSQGKQGTKFTNTGINAAESGWTDLKVAKLDKNMTISVQFVNRATNAVAFEDSFSGSGSKQYQIDAGDYALVTTINKANGNGKYSIELKMPEVKMVEFDQEEIPLEEYPAIEEGLRQNTISLMVLGVLCFCGLAYLFIMNVRKARKVK